MESSTKPDVRVINGWATIDTDGTYIAHRTKEAADRYCGLMVGDWDDPKVVALTTVIGDEAIPKSKVVELLREVVQKTIQMEDFAKMYYTSMAVDVVTSDLRKVRNHIESIAAKYGITNL